MLNTITTIIENNVWVNIAPVEAHKRYLIKYLASDFATVGLHIHEENSSHVQSIGIPGASAIANFEYRYTIRTHNSGYIAMSTNQGELTGIEVTEV